MDDFFALREMSAKNDNEKHLERKTGELKDREANNTDM